MTQLRGPATAQLLAGVPSLPHGQLVLETAQEVDRLVVDEAARLDLVWVRVRDRSGRPVTVVLAEGPAGAASAARALSRLVGTGPGRRWTTRAGGVLRWTGPAARPGGESAGLSATATNDLLAVRVEGRPAVLKAYRLLGSDRGESRLLAALAGRCTPRPLAEISYQPPDAEPLPLALVTERIPGSTLDRPLRQSLGQAWAAGRPELDPGIEAALTRVRSALAGFHAALARACGPWLVDPRHAADVRRKALRAELRTLAGDQAAVLGNAVAGLTQPDVGPAHGDLHLANVLLGADRVGFVDVAQPGPYGSPADDGAALRRAVECMALDVLVDRVAAARSRPPLAVVDDLLAGRGLLESVVPRELAVTSEWTALVCDLLDPWGARDKAGLAYLSRLVHDLRYHTDHADRYYAGLARHHLARYHLAQAGSRGAKQPTP